MYYNYKLEEAMAKRNKVRAEINKLMKRKDYYNNNNLYRKVSALTNFETYLTYVIEELERAIQNADVDFYD